LKRLSTIAKIERFGTSGLPVRSSPMADRIGLIDTNVIIHAHTSDTHAEDCRAFLRALECGDRKARIEPTILHELSFALPHYLKQMGKEEVGQYLLMLLSWPGVVGDINLLTDTVERWRATPGLSFADAYLSALALSDDVPVYSKNLKELRAQGVDAPSLLSS
jgi:predicted nucleic acid-binding protein